MTFTAVASPEAEARIAEDLDTLLAAVRAAAAADTLLAVFLIGGYARGEGAVVSGEDGRVCGFNDYDLLLLFAEPPRRPERYTSLSRELADRLEIDYVDLGLATRAQVAVAPPTLFWFEAGEAHRVLWRAPGCEDTLPRFAAGSLEKAEGSRLLVNRGMSLLWAARRLWPDRPLHAPPVVTDPAHVRFAVIASHKAVIAAGDAVLLRAGIYDVRQEVRLRTLAARPELYAWAGSGFLDAYRAAAAFRRAPVIDAAGAGGLWVEARAHHEAGFRAAETARLGADVPDWDTHARMTAARVRRDRLRNPRLLARWVRRGIRTGARLTGEETRFQGLPRLLYHAAPESRAWVEAADRLIGEWHD